MHETDETIMTSRLSNSAEVAEWRKLVYLVVDERVLFDVHILSGNIRFRLIVVVVRDEILNGVFGEELAELRAKLSGEGLVVRENERRSVQIRYDVRHCKGLARAGYSEQRLIFHSRLKARGQFCDSVRLVSRRSKRRMQTERLCFHLKLLLPKIIFLFIIPHIRAFFNGKRKFVF